MCKVIPIEHIVAFSRLVMTLSLTAMRVGVLLVLIGAAAVMLHLAGGKGKPQLVSHCSHISLDEIVRKASSRGGHFDALTETADLGAARPTFHAWFASMLVKHFGRAIAEAVYDPELFNTAAQSVTSTGEGTIFPKADDYVFAMKKKLLPDWVKRTRTIPPKHFNNISNMLWWNKWFTSIGVSRIARDDEIRKLYDRLVRTAADDNSLKSRLFETTVVRAVSAQVQYFHTVLQLAVDIALTQDAKLLLQQLTASHPGLDAMVLLSGLITERTTMSELDAMFSCHDLLTAVVQHRVKQVDASAAPAAPQQGLYPVYMDEVPFDLSLPANGKFWNMIRPTAGCSSIVRACEIPDGCRLLCNGEYLLRAGLLDTPQNHSRSMQDHHAHPFHHRIIGIGSNNQFDWELSFLKLFSATHFAYRGNSHDIGWMSSVDCTLTLAPGPRQWRVPASLRDARVGHTAVSMCADSVAHAANILTLADLKQFQLKIEASYSDRSSDDGAKRLPVVRSSAKDVVVLSESHGDGNAHKRFTMPAVAAESSSDRPRWFDALTIFKMDIERYEWNVIPSWLYSELGSIGKHASQLMVQGSTAPIDFEAAAPDFFSVSMFSLEIHRIGDDKYERRKSDIDGALRMHWAMMHIYALGFVMIAHEKNEIDQCCFEHTFSHVRHFIRSELWMSLREKL